MSDRKRRRRSNESNPPKKKHKPDIDEKTDSLLAAKINKLAEDDRINDVEFVVGIGNDTELIYGIKALFAASSQILKNMLYGNMAESMNNKVIINDVTIEAFEYIKQYTHFQNPSLEYKYIIDILYAAKKYMIEDVIKHCKDKLLSMNDADTFYLIMEEIGKYAPCTFESILSHIIKCKYVETNIHHIIYIKERFNKLAMFEVKLIFELIGNHCYRYNVIKSYCKANTNQHDNDWQKYFISNFMDLIDFRTIPIRKLMNDIRFDKILDNEHLLNLIEFKVQDLIKENESLLNGDKEESETINFKFNYPPPKSAQTFQVKMRRRQCFSTIIGPLEKKINKQIVGLSFHGIPILLSDYCSPQKLIDKFDAEDGVCIDVHYK